MKGSRCESNCPLCIANKKKRSNHKGHYGFRRASGGRARFVEFALIQEGRKMLTRKPAGEAAKADIPPELEACGNLIDFMTQTQWPDGTERAVGTIGLFFGEEGRLKAVLNDKAQGLVAFTTYGNDKTIFDWLDEAIVSSSTDWRKSFDKARPRK